MQNYFKSGSWNVYCMVCNRKIKSDESLKRWDGLIVCRDDYETRHPQDFLRTRQERMSVPFTSQTSFDSFNGPDYPIYPYCTQSGSSGVSGFAVAGCARPSLGFPNGLPLPPVIPDEPIDILIQLMSGGNLLLMNGNYLATITP